MFRRLLWVSILVTACGATRSGTNGAIRSPTVDYPPPPPQTSDGEIVGADQTPPEDKLRRGARVGPGGVDPSDHSASRSPEHIEPPEHPDCELGVIDASGEPRCKSRRKPRPVDQKP